MSVAASTSLDSVSVARQFQTSREALWNRVSTESVRTLWWPHSTLELKAGGAVVSQLELLDGTRCEQNGMMDVFIEGHAFGFAWRRPHDRDETSVLMTLTSLLGSTQLSILEIGFRTLPNAADRLSETSQHWRRCLDALAGIVAEPGD